MEKWLFLFLFYFMIIYIFILFIFTYYKRIYRNNIFYTIINLTSISNSLIIFSCFYDKRFDSIRLIGVSSSNVNLVCRYFDSNKYKSCDYKYVSLNKDSSGYNFKKKYINLMINIHNSTLPKKILLNNRILRIFNDNKIGKRNVLCITTFEHFVSYNLFLQSLKIYSHFGISDVYIYTSDINLNLEAFKLMKNITFHFVYILNEILLHSTFYFGQTVKYNDCLYRNMYKANYIIFADFDELIILKGKKNYDRLVSSLKKGDIYYFRSTICPTSNLIENKNFHIINDTSLRKTLNCCILNSFSQRKYLIKSPSKFIKINVHHIDYAYEKSKNIYVKEYNAYIHHSRIPTFLLLNHCSSWFYDIQLENILQNYLK